MIYDIIEEKISGFLILDFSLSSDQVLTQNEIPDEDINFFVRQVWTYGQLSDFSNFIYNEFPTLNLEIYERKNYR